MEISIKYEIQSCFQASCQRAPWTPPLSPSGFPKMDELLTRSSLKSVDFRKVRQLAQTFVPVWPNARLNLRKWSATALVEKGGPFFGHCSGKRRNERSEGQKLKIRWIWWCRRGCLPQVTQKWGGTHKKWAGKPLFGWFSLK